MSLKVMTWVFHESQAKGIDKLVLLAIADHAHDDGASAYPGMALLAKKAGVGTSTIARAVERLAKLGELEVTDRQTSARVGAVRGRGTRLAYRIVMDGIVPERDDKNVPERDDAIPESPADASQKVPLTPAPIEEEPYLRKNRKTARAKRAAKQPSANGSRTNALIKQWCDSLPERPPEREVGQLAKTITGLLDEGIAAGVLWQTLDQDYRHRDVGPAYLPNLVAARQRGAVRNGNGNGSGRHPGITDAERDRQLALTQQRLANDPRAAHYAARSSP